MLPPCHTVLFLTESAFPERNLASPQWNRACCESILGNRYAYMSQRGFYPDDREKANQDAYHVATTYDGDSNKVRWGRK